ncbi:MFS transporter [Egibacter rhizosphaerae]|uniref:MFS transporter n=2 Tax=Egibacter rhizosphaerae TaxID=1670831 RepID=A0A411YLB8_9ACTN|nr:MFS transporter [Egibacter rhizosphaerae]
MRAGDTGRAGPREWLGVAVLALPTMLLSLDLSVLYLALPHLSADLGATSTQQLWITDSYVFMTAGFLVTMGAVGDAIGRRRLLLIGAPAFGVASVLAAYAPTAELLILARGLLGIAGAMLLPSTLSLLRSMFGEPKQLGIAVAAWTTAYMAGVTLGPVIGGLMLQRFWWGSVFLLGVPVMALLLAVGPWLLPEHRKPGPAVVDLPSVGLSLGAVLSLVFGLKEVANAGWAPLPAAALAVGLALGAVFVGRQRRLLTPLIDLRLLRIPAIGATLLIALLVAATQNGTVLVLTQFLQLVEGLSPLRAGLWLAIPSLALIVTINATPHLAHRVRPGRLLATGLVVAAGGALVLASVPGVGRTGLLLAGAVVLFAGIGVPGALFNQLVLGAAPSERAGSAASMASTSGELGIALGIATFGSLATITYRGRLHLPPDTPSAAAGTARESIVDAVATARELPVVLGAEVLDAAHAAFLATLRTVTIANAGVFLAVAVVAAVTLREVRPTGERPSE